LRTGFEVIEFGQGHRTYRDRTATPCDLTISD
jgi:hypothetical protein